MARYRSDYLDRSAPEDTLTITAYAKSIAGTRSETLLEENDLREIIAGCAQEAGDRLALLAEELVMTGDLREHRYEVHADWMRCLRGHGPSDSSSPITLLNDSPRVGISSPSLGDALAYLSAEELCLSDFTRNYMGKWHLYQMLFSGKK